MLYNRLLFSIFIINYGILVVSAGVGFLRDQRKCKLKCQNGGVCAYVIGHPETHKCICMTDMYYGEECQFSVTSPPPTQRIIITTTTQESTTHIQPHRPIKIVPHSVEPEPEQTLDAETESEPLHDDVEEEPLEDDNEDEEEKESVEEMEETQSTETSYVTLEQAEQTAEEPEKMDDYLEPTETPLPQEESQENVGVASNGYFEPDTQMHQYQSSKNTHSVDAENAVEEEESGWMMVKRKTNFAFRSSFNFCNILFLAAIVFCSRYLF